MIYWFYGQPGSGKTTLGNALKEKLLNNYEYSNIIRIDGDEMRNIFQNKDYSEQGRRNNLRKVNDLIRFLYHKDYTVIVSVVAPYKDVRDEIKDFAMWEYGMPRSIDDYPDRVNKLKALGNAVVPECAELVGRLLKRSIEEDTIVFDNELLR